MYYVVELIIGKMSIKLKIKFNDYAPRTLKIQDLFQTGFLTAI
jgi:hypothetical protein